MITAILVVITAACSLCLIDTEQEKEMLCFYPYDISKKKQYYRFITQGLVHADYLHLLVNMYVLFLFGIQLEFTLVDKYGQAAVWLYLFLYFSALIAISLFSFFKYKGSPQYKSFGSTGAVSAVVMVYVLFFPLEKFKLLFIPQIQFYAIIFYLLYLIFSTYAARNISQYVEQNTPLYGALFGVVFVLLLDYSLAFEFVDKLLSIAEQKG